MRLLLPWWHAYRALLWCAWKWPPWDDPAEDRWRQRALNASVPRSLGRIRSVDTPERWWSAREDEVVIFAEGVETIALDRIQRLGVRQQDAAPVVFIETDDRLYEIRLPPDRRDYAEQWVDSVHDAQKNLGVLWQRIEERKAQTLRDLNDYIESREQQKEAIKQRIDGLSRKIHEGRMTEDHNSNDP